MAKAVLGLVATVAALALAPAAWGLNPPHIYWSDRAADTIGIANADGTGINDNFIGGANIPEDLSVDGQYIYWINTGNGTIGRASINGTGPKQNFITGASFPQGLAVNDSHIYWTNVDTNSIGAANLDGSGASQSFITGASSPSGVAVDSQHIYWSNSGNGTIGRANLDGTGVDQSFITGLSSLDDLAVDSQHIYWTGVSTLGEANLDGTAVKQSFITGADNAAGVAVDGQRIYWSNFSSGTVSAAELGGPLINRSLITVPVSGHPSGVAVSVPIAQVSPPTPFPSTPDGTLSQPETVTISNSGQADLSINSLSLAGSNASDYIISSNGCLGSVAPGQSCQLMIRFAPQAEGTRSAVVQIASNDFANSPDDVPLSGTGGAVPPGPVGGAGSPGPTGSVGTQAQAAKIELLSCRKARHHRRIVTKCAGRVVSGSIKFTAATPATVRRGRAVYASGVGVQLGGGAMEFVLSVLRPLRDGRYVLVLGHRRMKITVGRAS